MKKSTKGAIATGAAAVLLMGGAGTLAYWNAEGELPGGSITSGTLTLAEDDAASGWTLNGTAIDDAALADLLIVPSDILVYTGEYEIGATGDNLEAALTVEGFTASGDLASEVTLTPAFTVGGASTTTITDANDGQTLVASVTINFPFGTTANNDSQDLDLNLSGVTIAATQIDTTP